MFILALYSLKTVNDWVSTYKNLPPSAFQTADNSRPLHFIRRSPYTSRSVPEKDAYYIQLNQVDDATQSLAAEQGCVLHSCRMLSFITMCHSYHYIPPFVPFIDVPVSLYNLFQRVASIYDGSKMSLFD